MTDVQQLLEENHLEYVSGNAPGISRSTENGDFVYYDARGRAITNEKTLLRIRELVLPPAWQQVWIAPAANAHLQATGIDQAGRKQYRYHAHWCRSRNENKYYRLFEFAQRLPVLRKSLARDLRRQHLDERKVLAISVSLMQKTLIRVGNESYKQRYGSYGLSTLRDRHVNISGNQLRLSFKGKKGVVHDIIFTDRVLARLVKQCRDIPGQELFQFYGDDGHRHPIDSGRINQYIREISCCDFTAKDFRTWAGSLEALRAYARMEYPAEESQRKKNTVAVLDQVSARLGNTRTVCKKYYVFPALVSAYEEGTLEPFLKKLSRPATSSAPHALQHDEQVLLSFLRQERRRRKVQAAG